VLDPGIEPIGDFSLASAVEPVLAVHELGGIRLHCELAGLSVQGRIRETATVFANLLTNCQTHAPGATVSITARRRVDTVVICIEDDGPGLPETEWDQVLGRGQRGTAAGPVGTGLGLYTAQAAMRAQDGDLRLGRGCSGGTRVILTLPAARGVRAEQRLDAAVQG
jgi:two-component system OmpR family sensor kinase